MKTTKSIEIDQDIFLNSLLKGDHRKGSVVARSYSKSDEEIKLFYEHIVKPSLYKIGELWELNMITVAAEHLATSISESIMNELYEQVISDERVSKKVVLGCVENELHQVGIKMVADIFEMNGWDTFFLGASIPTSELISYAQDIDPNAIALSLTVYSHLPSLLHMIEEIRISLPEIPIVVGGQAFRHGGAVQVVAIPNVFIFNNLDEIELFIQNKAK